MADNNIRKHISLDAARTVENPKGIFRTTLAFEDKAMLCHFVMKKGAEIPLHHHEAVQIGYVVSGTVKFRKENGESFTAEPRTSYMFQTNEAHGAQVLADAEVIECFSPMRPEYADQGG